MSGRRAVISALILLSLLAGATFLSPAQKPNATGSPAQQHAASTQQPSTPSIPAQQPIAPHSPTQKRAAPDQSPTQAPTTEPTVDSVRILCLYGSVPAQGFEGREPMYGPNNLFNRIAKMHGGHVAIEYAPDKALSFQPLHYTGIARSGHLTNRANPKNFNSCFRIYTERRAWTVLGNYYNNPDSLRRATFVIPITVTQKKRLDSIAQAYVRQTPYDYSFLGM